MHVRRAVALAAIVPLLLAGCSDEAEPTPKIPDPTSSSPSPTATATESETVEAESAEDFIRRWVEAGDEMQVTGETAEYDAMSPDCKACQGFISSVEDVYEAGGYADFAGTQITELRRSASKPPTYDVSETVPQTVIHHGDTGKTERLPPGKTRIRVILKPRGSSWVVTYFGILA